MHADEDEEDRDEEAREPLDQIFDVAVLVGVDLLLDLSRQFGGRLLLPALELLYKPRGAEGVEGHRIQEQPRDERADDGLHARPDEEEKAHARADDEGEGELHPLPRMSLGESEANALRGERADDDGRHHGSDGDPDLAADHPEGHGFPCSHGNDDGQGDQALDVIEDASIHDHGASLAGVAEALEELDVDADRGRNRRRCEEPESGGLSLREEPGADEVSGRCRQDDADESYDESPAEGRLDLGDVLLQSRLEEQEVDGDVGAPEHDRVGDEELEGVVVDGPPPEAQGGAEDDLPNHWRQAQAAGGVAHGPHEVDAGDPQEHQSHVQVDGVRVAAAPREGHGGR